MTKEKTLSDEVEKIWIHEHKKFHRTYKDLILKEKVKYHIKKLQEELEEEKKVMRKRFNSFCEKIDFGKVAISNDEVIFMNDMFNGSIIGTDEAFKKHIGGLE